MFGLNKSKKFQGFERALVNSGWKFQFLIRVCPISPFNVMNYLIGLTEVSLWDNAIGMTGIVIPLSYEVYVGTQLKVLKDINKEHSDGNNTMKYVMIGIGILWGLALICYITHKAKKEIDKLMKEAQIDVESQDKAEEKIQSDTDDFEEENVNSYKSPYMIL